MCEQLNFRKKITGRFRHFRETVLFQHDFSAAISFTVGVFFTSAAGIGLLSRGFVCGLLLLLGLISRKRAILCGTLGIVCASLSIFSHQWHDGEGLPAKRVSGNCRIRVTDTRLSRISGLTRVHPVQAELLTFSLQEGVDYTPRRRICVYLPDHIRPEYGDIFRGKGVLLAPDSDAVWREDGYEQLVFRRNNRSAARGEERILILREAEKTACKPGRFAIFLKIRDRILERMLAGVKSDSIRSAAAALFFNAGGGLDPVVKKEFVLSGTIHLFCVSGMHVAVVTGIFLLLFLPLPFRLRHWLLPLAAGGYVLCTGAGVPALRVWFMVTVWSICRAELRWMPGYWTLALTAAGFLLYRPALAGDLGTQYTFLITGVLLVSHDLWEKITKVLDEKDRLTPGGGRKKRFLRRSLAPALYGCTVAFFGGLGISVAAQGLLLPGSVFTNLILTALLPVVFLLGLLPVIGLSGICGVSFPEMAFGILGPVARGSARIFEPVPVIRPDAWEIVLYYLLLFAFFGCVSRRVRWCAAVKILLLAGAWIYRAETMPPAILVLSSGSDEIPMAVVHDPEGDAVCVVNPSERNAVYGACDFLADRGVKRADLLTCSRPRSSYVSAAPQFLRRMEVSRIALPPEEKQSDAFYRKIELECGREAASHFRKDGEMLTTREEKGRIFVQYANRASGKEFSLEMIPEDAGRRIVVASGGKTQEKVLPWSIAPEGWVCTF